MAEIDSSTPFLQSFSGRVRLFPLPNLVLFPHTVQSLHIFEPRYVEMVEESLAGDQLLAPVWLQPGWERSYDGRPPVAPVACLGRIISHHRLPDGRINLLLQGMRRAAIRRELPATRAFRQAEVDLLDDFYPSSGSARRHQMQQALIDLTRDLLPNRDVLNEQFDELLASPGSLGLMTDVFAFGLSLSLAVKQQLLADWNVDRRARVLIEKLKAIQLASPLVGPPFLPPFSLN
ncbi:Lon protease [Anatilimnocola aggregata]|uniref:Lon protease n=1 Tax=Anatilimnocola aggregata TaxID=2528021 RepID=A0A517YMU7_9BACT|nr:LON peptidase substrate-binding domain-containing protein [Anatilimnocola aggregata]QDU31556.1 Lon protease [Anatilimnocola aggregata]